MTLKVYGIKNCSTMKKTFDFLAEEGVDYEFIDYKKAAPSEDLLREFIGKTGLEAVINKKGMTYRKLDAAAKASVEDELGALKVLADKSSMIKRPIIAYPDGSITLGFDPEAIKAKLAEQN
ncbi:MAG: Spx/MgsR family RNA polymerase-binding regulatory protein [Nitritalea sp.]